MPEAKTNPEQEITEQAHALSKLRQQQSAEAMSNATTLHDEEVSVGDVPLDDDLAKLFSEATTSEWQQVVLLLQLNRRLARMESAAKPPKKPNGQ